MEELLNTDYDMGDLSLHRQRRDLSWHDVKAFYDNKNNFAMYLVLPIMVIVYGGCAVFYCIARCRRYVKRKNKTALKNGSSKEAEPLEVGGSACVVHSVPAAHKDALSPVGVRVLLDKTNTHLLWQIPVGKPQSGQARNETETCSVAFNNKGFVDDCNNAIDEHQSSHPPLSYEHFCKPVRLMSKLPPYEEKRNYLRHGSVEEIITLDAPPTQKKTINGRKRRRPSSRYASRNTRVGPRDTEDQDDEEREKARQLVRGDICTKIEVYSPAKITRQWPSYVLSQDSQTRTQQSQPASHLDAKADPNLMARQAAQLLRLDHKEKQAGKNPKRLVYVTE